jgi:hypothetical protein
MAVEASDSDRIYKPPVMKVLGSLHAHGGLNVLRGRSQPTVVNVV